jgi:hypothetical protein
MPLPGQRPDRAAIPRRFVVFWPQHAYFWLIRPWRRPQGAVFCWAAKAMKDPQA